MEYKTPL